MDAIETMLVEGARVAAAKSDVRVAKKNGFVLICGTTQGLVELAALKTGRRLAYNLTRQGMNAASLAEGCTEAEIVAELSKLYVVEAG